MSQSLKSCLAKIDSMNVEIKKATKKSDKLAGLIYNTEELFFMYCRAKDPDIRIKVKQLMMVYVEQFIVVTEHYDEADFVEKVKERDAHLEFNN